MKGISPEKLDEIFDRFYKLESADEWFRRILI